MLIPHRQPLLQGRFQARYDRFIATVALGERLVEAHCVNPGRMEGLIRPGCRAWVSEAPAGSKRRLRYTLELMEIEGVIVGVNTVLPNYLAETVIRAGCIPGMKRFSALQREVRYGSNSRIDLLLTFGTRKHYVEVKNCHLVYPDGGAYFPDSVSKRAAGHLHELIEQVRGGDKASVLFVLQRRDGRFLRPSRLHDPQFAAAAREAGRAGVRFRCAHFDPTPEGFYFLGTVPVDLTDYDSETLQPFRAALDPFSGWKRRGKARPPSPGGA